jgi:hypothetical protein
MSVYTEVTLQTLRERLAGKLGDPGMVFWAEGELTGYLNESLTTWQAFSGYWTERYDIPLVAGQAIYDLPSLTASPLAYTALSDSLIARAKQVMLEPATLATFLDQYPSPQIDGMKFALRANYEQWLRDTGLITTYQELAGQEVVALPERNLELRHAEWKAEPTPTPATHYYTELRETQSDQANYTTYFTNGQPRGYVSLTQPINSVRLYPPPEDIGKLAIFNLQLPTQDDLDADPLPIPPSLDWVLKYSMLQDQFEFDGQCRDPHRAEYCARRYEDSLVLGRNYPSVYNCWLNGRPIVVGGVKDVAARRPRWHNTPGLPAVVGMVSWNHLIVAPQPTSAQLADTPLTLTVEVQSQPPLLVDDADTVQLPREYHELLVDFAHHLAMLKTSGAEFAMTIGAYKDLLEAAMEFNQRLQARAADLWLFKKRATTDQQSKPRWQDQGKLDETGMVSVGGRK